MNFAGEADQADDITILAVEFNGQTEEERVRQLLGKPDDDVDEAKEERRRGHPQAEAGKYAVDVSRSTPAEVPRIRDQH